jgi:DNA gyrase/topoisomerase IV subunit B
MANDTIKKLTDSQHIRLRTEMYLGSRSPHTQVVINWLNTKLEPQEVTWVPAVYTAFREIMDNALDEICGHGHGNRIDITYDEDSHTFTVKDNGRGIPTDWDQAEQMHKATMVLVYPRAGRNFDEREVVRGTNGIGASATVHTSSRASVTVWRNNEKFHQTFTEPTALLPELQMSTPKITKASGDKTGTEIEFVPSAEVFKNRTLPLAFVKARVQEVAVNHPEVKFYFNGEKVAVKPTIDKSFFSDVEFIKVAVEEPNFESTFYLVPQFAEEGEFVHSTVNDIPAFNGGNHIDVFKRVFFSNLLKSLERESRKRGLTPNRSDVSEGILVYNVTSMHAPNFDSQSKTRLINEDVGVHVKNALDDDKLYKRIVKDHKSWIDQIYARCAARTQKKDDADTAKAARKVLRAKVPKLMDATGKDRSKCILMIAEGDSAVSSVSSVRDPEIHGGLPLRGKILNVRGESNKTILDSAICQDIMSSIGLVLGAKVQRADLRYGQVWITCDADTDGANIMALLTNFFYIHWPTLFDPKQPPYFLVFSTPFIIQEGKKKERHYWYADDYDQYVPGDWKGCAQATRAKGLGSLEEIDWMNSLAKPRLIPLVDDGRLEETLSLIFDKAKADQRKAWMGLN